MGWMGAFFWDPNPHVFVIPGLNRPITWYGVFFALGFYLGYRLLHHLVALVLREDLGDEHAASDARIYTDRVFYFSIVGVLVGARLGHVLFYEWSYFRGHFLEIVKIWNGGLASHGAACGGLLALFLLRLVHRRQPTFGYFSFFRLLDLLVVVVPFIGGLIRCGNFVNQEIVGLPTSLPWAVIFGHPFDGASVVPRHPVQLYEALSYFATALLLYFVASSARMRRCVGLSSGLFFLSVFGSRFFLEIFKERQTILLNPDSPLSMGQILSLPFIFLGLILIFRASRGIKKGKESENYQRI